MEDIKNKLDEILSLYDKDECRCGGYSMTQYSHITAPEDYIESISGKQGSASYSKLLTEFRNTFLNIDMMVIEELSDLFMYLW